MATDAADRVMVSERVAPGMLPRVLNSFDMEPAATMTPA